MKIYIAFFVFILSSLANNVYSQKLKKKSFLTIHQFEQMSNNITNFDTLNVANYTQTSLFFNNAKGENKQVQIPNKQTHFGLQTEGIQALKNGLLFKGGFTIQKEYWKESVWNLTYQQPKDYFFEDPHYYAVEKPGNWNNQNYLLNGGVMIPLTKTNTKIGLETVYNLKESFRTQYDPRPRIKYKELAPQISIHQTINPEHAIALSYQNTNKSVDEITNYSDKNDNFPVNTDVFMYWYAGYGTILLKEKTSTRRDINKNKIQINYTFKKPKLTVYSLFGYQKGELDTFKSSSYNVDEDDTENPPIIYNYNTTTLTAQSYFYRNVNKTKQQLFGLKLKNYTGDNFLISFQGKNYTAKQTKATVTIGQTITQNNINKHDFIADIIFLNSDMQDALSQTGVELQEITFLPTYTKDILLNEKLTFSPKLKVGYKMNLNAKLTDLQAYKRVITDSLEFSKVNQKNFYDQVVLPDYNYAKNNQLIISPSMQFVLKNDKKRKSQDTFFDLNYNHRVMQNTNKTQNRGVISAKVGLKF